MRKQLLILICLAIGMAIGAIVDSLSVSYEATLLSDSQVYDGDTLKDVRVSVYRGPRYPDTEKEVWPGVWMTPRGVEIETDIRINGIDTPEKRASTKHPDGTRRSEASRNREKAAAAAARQTLVDLLARHDYRFTVLNPVHGKYAGRTVAHCTIGGVDVAEYLIELGHAKPYRGGTKPDWNWGK